MRVNQVNEVEYHLLDLCGCDECVKARDKSASMPPSVAHAMGFISNRSEGGSVAAKLSKEERTSGD